MATTSRSRSASSSSRARSSSRSSAPTRVPAKRRCGSRRTSPRRPPNADGSIGAAIAPNRLPGIQEAPRRRLTIRNLISPGRTDSPLIEYIQEVGFTNNAAPVAEGAAKPQSSVQLIDKQTSTKVIAHLHEGVQAGAVRRIATAVLHRHAVDLRSRSRRGSAAPQRRRHRTEPAWHHSAGDRVMPRRSPLLVPPRSTSCGLPCCRRSSPNTRRPATS